MKCVTLYLIVELYFFSNGFALKHMLRHPCVGQEYVTSTFRSGQPPGEENRYAVSLRAPDSYWGKVMTRRINVTMEFDAEATISMHRKDARVITVSKTYSAIELFETNRSSIVIYFNVNGAYDGPVPYFRSLKYDYHEYCEQPVVGDLDDLVQQYRQDSCGRRKIEYTELLFNAMPTSPGDWPWHSAIYHRGEEENEYKCGGTLITKTAVLTAAHCVTTFNKVPVDVGIITVVLGKYYFNETESTTQEIQVSTLAVHEKFGTPKRLDNDIALLNLKTEVIYSEYIQRACLWYNKVSDRITTDRVYGSVAGWGYYDGTKTMSSELKYSSMPIRTYVECILKYPTFYDNVMKNKSTFCAGWGNGTSPCNGDSGGGFVVFVPDPVRGYLNRVKGRWFIFGLVSLALTRPDTRICDPDYYVVFTDISKYQNWILSHLDNL